jgi:cobyrinic acid a,c-diamide synthase
MAALRQRGYAVSPHKVGPDYIDPTYHCLATGRPGRNLDPVLVGEGLIGPLFAHGAAGADVAIIEGVMGLFDGRAATGEGSTAHVARLLDAPVLLVVDASAQSTSVAALVHGFASYDPSVRIAGIVLNRVASPRHEQLLRESLGAGRTAGIPVVGALPRTADVAVPSRHLGLIPAQERGHLGTGAVAALGALAEAHLDLPAILALAVAAGDRHVQPWSARDAVGEPVAGSPVVAVAGGDAFTFGYPETAELLEACGAQVAVVDPLRDEHLPPGTRALVIGGGFPEVHAEQLAANEALRLEVSRLAASGAPIAAECAGLLYLAQSLDAVPMCGVLPARAEMTSRLTLGYRDATRADGTRVRAHEFHRTRCTPMGDGVGAPPAYTLADGTPEGFAPGRVHASYLHLHWAGSPQLARQLVAAA